MEKEKYIQESSSQIAILAKQEWVGTDLNEIVL
jgi:hypothetical protein